MLATRGRTDGVVQNVPHNQCMKLHDGSDLGHQLGVSDATFPITWPTSKAASPSPISFRPKPGPWRFGDPPRSAGRVGRHGRQVGDARTGFGTERQPFDAGRFGSGAEPVDIACGTGQPAGRRARRPLSR